MSGKAGLSFAPPEQAVIVQYADLGGGLNTRLDPHALQRNELAESINLWSAYDNAIAKRPGSVAMVTTNAAIPGAVPPLLSISEGRFNDVTYLIVLDSAMTIYAAPDDGIGVWVNIGSAGAGAKYLQTAQMFNPKSQQDQVFICDGVSIPQTWAGPGHTLNPVDVTAGHLPGKYNSTTPITPQFVKTLGNNSHLFYSGEPTNRSAVYISDPFYPESFNNAAMQVTTDPRLGSYQPAVIGNNDGVEGGFVTGMESLGSAMVIFKESALYSMVQTTLLGEVPAWQVVQIFNGAGNAAPRSLARFSTFISFLGVDGVYVTDGQSAQQISGDVPTFFDSSLNGVAADIDRRERSIAVRHGMRLLLFFCTELSEYPNQGLWFDFTKQSRFGNPIAGEIRGMNVAGAVSLRGGGDDGNVAWVSATQNAVRRFGVGHADGQGNQDIQTAFAGKADLFDDVFGSEAMVSRKQVQDAYALIEIINSPKVKTIDFFGAVLVDLSARYGRVIGQPVTVVLPGFLWGAKDSLWGKVAPPAAVWTAAEASQFMVVKIPLQGKTLGTLMQVSIRERSIVPWVIIGYAVYVNKQKVGY